MSRVTLTWRRCEFALRLFLESSPTPFSLTSQITHLPEHVHVELLEAGTCDGRVEVDTLVQGVDFDGSLSSGRECALGPLAGCAKTTKGTGVVADILLVLPLELLLITNQS